MSGGGAARAMPGAAILWLLVFLPLGWSTHAAAQDRQPRVNYEYRVIPQQPVSTGERIEVIEFFWYRCPYCYQLQPPLAQWLARKPPDVELRRIPAIFRESWVPHARVFYTLQGLGELSRLHQAVYRALHVDGENLGSAEASAAWAARHGIDPARWTSMYGSPEVDQHVRDAIASTRSYVLHGTPSLVVDGRYITSTGMSETIAGVVGILDDLIRIARAERAAR